MIPVNFDANASCRPISKVRELLAHYRGDFLNPSSVHSFGQTAKAVIDEANHEICALIGAKKTDKIIFTSGASEANNAALRPDFKNLDNKVIQLACSNVEHASVLECLRKYSEQGYGLKEFSIKEINSIEDQKDFVNDNLKIFALMAANNESGEIFDIKNIFAKIKKLSPRTRLHCDAVQAAGKIPVNFCDWQVDTMSISGHKIGAISGVGALVVAEHVQLEPWIYGGPQQFSLRAGTENILGIKTLAIAAREARIRLEKGLFKMKAAKQQLLALLSEFGELVEINKVFEQLPNTVNLRIPGIKADDLVVALDLCSVAISAGSACASGKPNPSHVLLAQGLSKTEAKESIRISLEPEVSEEDLSYGLKSIRETISRMTQSRRAA